MTTDKYSAVWVSHSSISDFLKCPRAYFLKNVYRDPKNQHKIKLVTPPLVLGQAVHEVIESLSLLPIEDRFKESLGEKFEKAWSKISGQKGGFTDKDVEMEYKNRGYKMIKRVIENPGPLKNLAVKIGMDLPYFWLSEEDNIILCGKIDWLEYLKEKDSIHIIDFKTSRKNEPADSLQLAIYHLLVSRCQKRKVEKGSYWYLENSDIPIERRLPNIDESFEKILKIAKQIKLARQLRLFKCSHKTGCKVCEPYEKIISGKAKFVGVDDYGCDTYTFNESPKAETRETVF